MARIPLPLQSYDLRNKQASITKLLNCFAEPNPEGKQQIYITRSPGVAAWTTVGDGPIHAMHSALSSLFVVSKSTLYSVDSAGTATSLGSIGTVSDRANVDISSDASNVVVVNNPNAYVWNGSTLTQISDADFTSRGAGDVEYVDTYMMFREPDSARFFASDSGDPTAYDALQFSTADADPDDLNGMIVDHRQVVLFGPESGEIWENTGISGFPFQRMIGGYIEQGLLATRCLDKLDNSIYWAADDRTVRRLDGVTPVRVSTHAIEQWLSGATKSSGVAYSYKQDGHLFVVLTFTEGTRVLDATTGLWHERKTYTKSKWDWVTHARAYDLELVGDSTSNNIGKLDPTTYADLGSTQRMEWTYPTIYAEQRRAFHHRLEIVVNAGEGLTTGQGSDPKIMLEKSDDGGKTWQFLPSKSLGLRGKYESRVVWHGLGSARQRAYRASVSDPVPLVVTDTQLEVTGGRL